MRRTPRSRIAGWARLVGGNALVICVLLLLIEGIASYTLTFREILRTRSLAERRHARYDPDLGWVNQANAYVPDMYGPGVYMRTNSQGFRSDHDIEAAVPEDKVRVVCTGDSFTLGYGVDNEHAWCQLLESLDSRIETINMGQGGYGIDQAYLLYKREASAFRHQVHLFAFITEDFSRTGMERFAGYGRPLLEAENGELVVRNAPVPKPSRVMFWLTANRQNLRRLRTVDLSRRLLEKVGLLSSESKPAAPKAENPKTSELFRLIAKDLIRLNDQRSSKLVLVFLPTERDLREKGPQDWVQLLEEESGSLSIPFIDLVSEFRRLPFEETSNIFIRHGAMAYQGAAGHFNERGNELVARLLYERLRRDPQISLLLSRGRDE